MTVSEKLRLVEGLHSHAEMFGFKWDDASDWTWHDVACKIADEVEAENAKLRKDLEFERSENGWAREFLNRMGQKCGTKDCPSLVAYVTKLESENEKLRELVRELYEIAQPEAPSMFEAEFADRMRELGMEVDE